MSRSTTWGPTASAPRRRRWSSWPPSSAAISTTCGGCSPRSRRPRPISRPAGRDATWKSTPFAANCAQRLRADQLYDSLKVALGIDEFASPFAGRGPRRGRRVPGVRGPRMQFAQTFGYDPSNPRDELTGSIPQALFLMNNPMIQTALDGKRTSTVLGQLLTRDQGRRDARQRAVPALPGPRAEDRGGAALAWIT